MLRMRFYLTRPQLSWSVSPQTRHVEGRVHRLLLSFGFVATIAGALGAQLPYRQIIGSVRDSVSGRPPLRTRVCAWADSGSVRPLPQCGSVDSLGQYRIDSIPPGRRLVAVHCATIRAPGMIQLAFEHLVMADTDVRRDWSVSAAGCDSRRVRHVTGTFRGHYTVGFEASAFVPCASDAWVLPSDSLGDEPYLHRAWVTWPPAAARQVHWPDAPRDRFGSPRYYVKWRGTVTGPGNYGHLGVSPFEFRVDSVLIVRPPQPADCH